MWSGSVLRVPPVAAGIPLKKDIRVEQLSAEYRKGRNLSQKHRGNIGDCVSVEMEVEYSVSVQRVLICPEAVHTQLLHQGELGLRGSLKFIRSKR